MDKSNDKNDDKKNSDIAGKFSRLSDLQLKQLADMAQAELKKRSAKGSDLGAMSDSEFRDYVDQLDTKSEKSKKDAA